MKKSLLLTLLMLTASIASAQSKIAIDWADIPAETFTMGSPATEKGRGNLEAQHQVIQVPFKLAIVKLQLNSLRRLLTAPGIKLQQIKKVTAIFCLQAGPW